MSDKCCENHTCAAPLKESGTHYTCPLCHDNKFCSESCYQMGQSLHECPNQLDAEYPLETHGIALPYHYEDLLTQDQLNDLDPNDAVFAAYSVRHAAANRVISQMIIPPLVEHSVDSKPRTGPTTMGSEPLEWMKQGGEFQIHIEAKSYRKRGRDEHARYAGLIPRDMIFPNNLANRTASQLASQLYQGIGASKDYLIFWPADSTARNPFEIDARSSLTIELRIKRDGVFAAMPDEDFHIGFVARESKWRFGQRVKENFQVQLRKKFGKANITNLHVVKYGNPTGGVLITYRRAPNSSTVQIVDIEIHIQKDRLVNSDLPMNTSIANMYPISKEKYTCDPRNFNNVCALVMSIGHVLATTPCMDKTDEQNLRNCEAVITKYAHEMEANNGECPHQYVPSHVQSAIASAMDLTYEQIGRSASYYRNKMDGSVESIENLGSDLIIKITKLRQKKKNPVVSKQKGMLVKELKKFNEALQKRINTGDPANKMRLESLRERIVQAQNA